MSVPVDLSELAEQIESFGPVAYLVTTGESGAPHIVSVVPAWNGEELTAPAGSRTGGNVEAHERVSLLWAAPAGADYCLIVDGAARLDENRERLAIVPTRAVLHRLPSADASLPSCVTVL